MKKICFLIENLNHSGGTERVTSLIANALAKQNYEVSIVSLADGSQPFFQLESNIQTYSLYPQKISMKRNFLSAVWRIRRFVTQHKIDTLIVVDSISCVFTVPALVGLNIKHVCWEHFNFNVDLGVKFRRLGRAWAAKYCDIVVTLTKRDKQLWEKNLQGIRATLIPIANPSPYENIQHTLSKSNQILLAVGRLNFQKGFDFLIDVWAKVCSQNNDWLLRIVGSGEGEETLKQQVQQLELSDRVEFISATKDISQHYMNASFYCMSSRFEGLPMVLLEAQAYGLPVIAFDCDTGPAEVVVDGTGFLIPPGDIEGYASQLLKLIDMNELEYVNMCRAAKENNRKFYLENIIGKWVAEIV
ncbi:glycosyltransferase family 4 protein [Acinetobacter ursingii]|uniref:glycosyltransferase family 4 protein n=1 Tax=Acinetobacter ursingii TaxID=108980 RepID=UPI0030082DF9